MDAVVILAGGKSRRMGRDKLELLVDGQTMLESVVGRFSEVFDDVFLSVADADKYPDVSVRRVVDIYPGAGPLSGLHSALTSLSLDGVFLVAADLPFACPFAAKRIIELSADYDACLIKLNGGMIEPLFGFYRKSLLPRCEQAIALGRNRMADILDYSGTRFVVPDELGDLWDAKMISNINYPEDYERLQF